MLFSTMFSPTLNLAISSTTNSSRRRVSSSRRGVNSMRIRSSSTEKGESKEKDQDDKSPFNPFGFVTDNPSSISTIHTLPYPMTLVTVR
ncbi:hypothetical protein TSUD_95520 [Trifolium subterraneum]|uniref:Uncharacterized protein n=1 Tax=Trifolium subterraneum TaxID=3900 RepID=A0A2Z6MNR5_TRISU|nr:hypothetical protein TSUD_95520 [Trifolium subterraneum]